MNNIILFTGAGFTKSIWEEAPLLQDFMGRVLNNLYQSYNKNDFNKIYRILKKFFPTIYNFEQVDYEIFLGYLNKLIEFNTPETFISENDAEKLWRVFVKAMAQVMHYSLPIQDTVKPPRMQALYEFLKSLKNQCKKVTVITANYDLIIDKINQYIIDNQLGYGNFYNYKDNPDSKLPPDLKRYQYGGIRIGGVFEVINGRSKLSVVSKKQKWKRLDNEIQIYKLHGSFNWGYCPRCKIIHLAKSIKDLYALYDGEKRPSCAKSKCKDKYQPVFVPPIVSKELKEPLKIVWKKAAEELFNADAVIFIGYSLPAQDPLVAELLLKTRARASHRKKAWDYIVIDPDNDNRVHNRYKSFFGEAKSNFVEIFRPEQFYKYWSAF